MKLPNLKPWYEKKKANDAKAKAEEQRILAALEDRFMISEAAQRVAEDKAALKVQQANALETGQIRSYRDRSDDRPSARQERESRARSRSPGRAPAAHASAAQRDIILRLNRQTLPDEIDEDNTKSNRSDRESLIVKREAGRLLTNIPVESERQREIDAHSPDRVSRNGPTEVKRGPGRPRKMRQETESNSSDGSDHALAARPKGTRGRPRNTEQAKPVAVKGKRGRPSGKWNPLGIDPSEAESGDEGRAETSRYDTRRKAKVASKTSRKPGLLDDISDPDTSEADSEIASDDEVVFDEFWTQEDENEINKSTDVERNAWYWSARLIRVPLPDLIPRDLRSYETWTPGCLTEECLDGLYKMMKLAPFRPAHRYWKDPRYKFQRRKCLWHLRWAMRKMVFLRLDFHRDGLAKKHWGTIPSVAAPHTNDLLDIVIPRAEYELMKENVIGIDSMKIAIEDFRSEPRHFKFLVEGLSASENQRDSKKAFLCQSDTTNLVRSWDLWVKKKKEKDPFCLLQISEETKLPYKSNVSAKGLGNMRRYYKLIKVAKAKAELQNEGLSSPRESVE